MLSIVSSIRQAVSQTRSRWQGSLATSVVATAKRHNSNMSMDSVADEFMSRGNAPLTPPSAESYPGGISYDEISLSSRGGFHFKRNEFISPQRLSHKALTKQPKPRRRSLLGPNRKESERLDMFHQLQIDPLHEAMNSRLLSYFVTEMGKIKPRSATKLTWRSQRRLGKAIRRAKMMGVIPVLSRRVLLRDERDF
ncbi:mitochondrial ribosomal protein S18 [Fomitopsis betulina]|nr:mitochondrial ribosomal protein S18 [Fomitopsis betulina]